MLSLLGSFGQGAALSSAEDEDARVARELQIAFNGLADLERDDHQAAIELQRHFDDLAQQEYRDHVTACRLSGQNPGPAPEPQCAALSAALEKTEFATAGFHTRSMITTSMQPFVSQLRPLDTQGRGTTS